MSLGAGFYIVTLVRGNDEAWRTTYSPSSTIMVLRIPDLGCLLIHKTIPL